MLSQADKLWHLGVMNVKPISTLILAALAATAAAQTPAPSSSPAPAPTPPATPAPDPAKLAPSEIVAAAPASEWVTIAPEDMLVMTLANDRRVVIQLMPPPFSQGWIGNIRKLATAHWWDGLSINRLQDNYVVQWGDADGEDKAKAKPLPKGLKVMRETEYVSKLYDPLASRILAPTLIALNEARAECRNSFPDDGEGRANCEFDMRVKAARPDPYAQAHLFYAGWPLALGLEETAWPIHCYGMIGVGRNLSPDTGSGAEIYTVIGHAPRHLDRNIAVVGRVISGIESLSSLPRGTGALGFYEKPEERVGIKSIRLASELSAAEQPRFEYLSTVSASFARYAFARANRRDAFFNVPAGGADICNIPVPMRKKP